MSHWNAVAAGWAAWLGWTEREFRPVTRWFIERAALAEGARVLDVACGAGYPALAIARHIGPTGRVLAADIASEMVAVTEAAAVTAELRNVECRRMDAERLEMEDASVDAVTNAYGLMFCPDAPGAIREAYRVLAPRGRVALVTWDELAKSSFFNVALPVGAKHLGLAPPQPGGPGPFRFSSPDALALLLRDGGFEDVRVEVVTMPLTFAAADEYCQVFCDVAWTTRVATLSQAQLEALRADMRHAAAPYVRDGRLELGASSLCASGVKR